MFVGPRSEAVPLGGSLDVRGRSGPHTAGAAAALKGRAFAVFWAATLDGPLPTKIHTTPHPQPNTHTPTATLLQDLPNYSQHMVPIFSLPQEWLWCETWCGGASRPQAKTIDLCNNPMTKEPKLQSARRIIAEWPDLDREVGELTDAVRLRGVCTRLGGRGARGSSRRVCSDRVCQSPRHQHSPFHVPCVLTKPYHTIIIPNPFCLQVTAALQAPAPAQAVDDVIHSERLYVTHLLPMVEGTVEEGDATPQHDASEL